MIPLRMIANEAESLLGTVLKGSFGMSFADFNTIIPIDILGSCTQVDIARFNRVSEAAVSKRIAHLIKDGLIERGAASDDMRTSVLQVTKKGKERMCAIHREITAKMETVFADFPQTDRDQLRELLLAMLPLIMAHSPKQEMLNKSQHPVVKKLFGTSV